MNDPTRLLDDGGDEFERALLGSARLDRGSMRARYRALATFGALGLKFAASAASASPAAFAAAAAPSGAVGASVPSLTVGVLAKWLGTGVLVGGVSVGSVYAVQERVGDSVTPPRVTASNQAEGPRAAEQVPRAQRRAPELPRAASEAPRQTGGRDSKQPVDPAVPAPEGATPSNGAFPLDAPSSRLGEELAALDRARRSLRSGDHPSALRELARYEARFPRGELFQEATLLSVEARLEAGDRAGARAIAERVLAVDSTSPHARRLQALLSTKETR